MPLGSFPPSVRGRRKCECRNERGDCEGVRDFLRIEEFAPLLEVAGDERFFPRSVRLRKAAAMFKEILQGEERLADKRFRPIKKNTGVSIEDHVARTQVQRSQRVWDFRLACNGQSFLQLLAECLEFCPYESCRGILGLLIHELGHDFEKGIDVERKRTARRSRQPATIRCRP